MEGDRAESKTQPMGRVPLAGSGARGLGHLSTSSKGLIQGVAHESSKSRGISLHENVWPAGQQQQRTMSFHFQNQSTALTQSPLF